MQVSPSVPHPPLDAVDELESLPAGPVLAAALADIDVAALDGFDAVLVLKARARQANHARGELFASMADVLSRQHPHGPPTDTRDAYGVFEVAAALTMSRPAAHDLCELAWDLSRRLPRVLAAMRAGQLDQAKAAVLATYTRGLCDEQAKAIVDALLPKAAGWTPGQLREAIARRAIALDPEWTRRAMCAGYGIGGWSGGATTTAPPTWLPTAHRPGRRRLRPAGRPRRGRPEPGPPGQPRSPAGSHLPGPDHRHLHRLHRPADRRPAP